MMHKVKLGEIMENAVRLCGRDVTLSAVPTDWRVLAGMSINEGIRRIAAEKFPMMFRIESRRYRPDWKSGVSYAVGNQVWHGCDYWELKTAPDGNEEPGTGDAWVKVEMKDMPAFISWEQPWENTVIDRGGVDVNRFAYEKSPLYYPNAEPIRTIGMSSFGVELMSPAPKEVYVRFVPQFPRVGFDEWTSGTLYVAGDVVYRTASKDCYIALKDVDDETKAIVPGSAEDEIWQEVRIEDVFEPFLVRLVAADLLTESQGKFQTAARAEAEFENLCERYHEGNGESVVRTGRFC